ncbi:MAG: hypothetical protein ACI85I_001787 [Arenicella sp.]|jgi:hypothetical protein
MLVDMKKYFLESSIRTAVIPTLGGNYFFEVLVFVKIFFFPNIVPFCTPVREVNLALLNYIDSNSKSHFGLTTLD